MFNGILLLCASCLQLLGARVRPLANATTKLNLVIIPPFFTFSNIYTPSRFSKNLLLQNFFIRVHFPLTIWTANFVDGLHPPWPAVYETRVQLSSEWSTNIVHSNTASTWRWRRKMARIFRRSVPHDIHHTFGRQGRKVLLRPVGRKHD